MFVSDTHGWLWHLSGDENLGSRADEIFNSADDGGTTILLPTIVVVESVYVAKESGYNIEMQKIIDDLRVSSNYFLKHIGNGIVSELVRDDRELSIHDNIIVIAAEREDIPIISKDEEIKRKAEVEVIW